MLSFARKLRGPEVQTTFPGLCPWPALGVHRLLRVDFKFGSMGVGSRLQFGLGLVVSEAGRWQTIKGLGHMGFRCYGLGSCN